MYQLRSPAPELRPWIEHYWFVTDDDGPVDLRVDAFVDARADLVFNFGVPYRREVIGSGEVVIASSNLDAQRLVPIRIHQAGRVRTTGVRFHLGGLAPFAQVPLRPLTGTTTPPEVAFGPRAAELEPALRSLDIDAQALRLDAFFRSALDPRPNAAWTRALALAAARPDATGPDLARAAGCSVRHVERLFARHLGVAPKLLARIVRFQRTLRHLMREPAAVLAEVAHAAGYFDHAHFIRDFRRFTGGVPRGYRGYYPSQGPDDFAPNVVVFVQDDRGRQP